LAPLTPADHQPLVARSSVTRGAVISHSWRGHRSLVARINPDRAGNGTIRLVERTTIYLPDDLKSAVKRAADQRGISEAEVIRDALRSVVAGERPRPQGGLFSSGDPIARTADEHMPGHG